MRRVVIPHPPHPRAPASQQSRISHQDCPSCGRSTSSAGGLCDACRLGVPPDTPALHVVYPPEPKPLFRTRLRRALLGPTMTALFCIAIGITCIRLADIHHKLRPFFFPVIGTALGLALAANLIYLFSTYSLTDLLDHTFRRRTLFHDVIHDFFDDRQPRPDSRLSIICTVLALTLLLGYFKFGTI